MKTVFDATTRDELIRRINTLNENSKAQWGRMTVYQMLKHCRLWEEMMMGRNKYKRVFIGRLFGRIALKSILKDEKPLARNTPSIPELIITENGDIPCERSKWIALIEAHGHFSNPGIVHPFFGKVTKEQVGYMAYKHSDHHLRQFNC